jgi:hypothetical protein
MDLQQKKGFGVEGERFKRLTCGGNMLNTCGKCFQNSTDCVGGMVHKVISPKIFKKRDANK